MVGRPAQGGDLATGAGNVLPIRGNRHAPWIDVAGQTIGRR
jgi:hypothetical protein